MSDEPLATSVFQSTLPLTAKLDRARLELLDLSARNRLLNMPRSSRTVRTIEIVDEKSTEIYRLLVREGRAFTFIPGRASKPDSESDPEEIHELAQPEDDSVDERGVLNRHSDTKLQTRLTSGGLQKRLLDLYGDARTLEEEQGVNILYLTLGSLKWIDPANANNVRYAPLILVPATLERGTAAERFKLKWRQEELAANLSLEAFLDRAHSLKLPHLEAGDDFDPAAYMREVADSVSSKEGWEVLPDDVVLGFFSFAKFLMYRDLNPEVWPEEGKLTELPMVRSLLAEGFPQRDSIISEDAPIDPLIPPAEMLHVVDSDSSQMLAIYEARAGHSLVIQGPPGTGKSQTIANVIAAAIADGKTVLFVAEKMAALEVVKRRLDQSGAGDACLELHSNKANKRLLLDELRRTWELGSPRGDFADSLNARLQDARDALNAHAQRMHRPHLPSGLTPYQVIGELTRLRDQGQGPTDIALGGPEHWSADERDEREKLLAELTERLREIGCPSEHPWCGVGLESILPIHAERILRRIGELKLRLERLAAEQGDLSRVLETAPPGRLRDFENAARLARRIATAPDSINLGASAWDDRWPEITPLLDAGAEYARLSQSLRGKIQNTAWTADLRSARDVLGSLPANSSRGSFDGARRMQLLMPQWTEAAQRLAAILGVDAEGQNVGAIHRLLEMGRQVVAAPSASPEAFTAAVWDHGIGQVHDLVDAVAALENARAQIGNRLAEAAWSSDCTAPRHALASHGTSLLRFLSGEWRRANRLVQSFLNPPDLPLTETISLLDSLIVGQRALSAIHKSDALGRAAFGFQWRGDRSNASELRPLLEWMRGLGPLAREIRAVASQDRDRAAVETATTRLALLSDECDPLLHALSRDFPVMDGNRTEAIVQYCSAITQADTACAEVMTEIPPVMPDRLSLLDQIIAAQDASHAISDAAELGQSCFGSAWAGNGSPWPLLRSAAGWIDANRDIRALASRIAARAETAVRADAAESQSKELLRDVDAIFADLRHAENDLPTAHIKARFERWLAHPEDLSKWVAYRGRADRARALGLTQLVDRLEDGRLAPKAAASVFRHAYFEAILEDQVRQTPEIGRFDGHLHGRLTRDFADLDRQRIAAARLQVVRAHHRRIPQGGGIGPLGVLRAEIAKRRGHMPIRQLMLKAAQAIQALKPVMMMSPLSVAQFLPPGQLTFDLLVMDEASQIQPVDALGAIARCRQVVVVGDERQLPPTKFFAKMTGAQSEDDDAETSQVADIESILGLFIARGMPQRMLRWHYRSRHQSLIAVSNTQFYENKLFIVPSPYTSEAGRGLRFHHISEGRFDTGNSRTNVIEAKAVAEAVIKHAQQHPELSLGVAAFSANQRRAIRDQIELLRRLNPETESFFNAHAGEPFFVKNLENVQGDERDVIFISVGYGKNARGDMSMLFGPLSSEGGERRLNVLISRAKLRCDVFASITDEDIDTERGKGKGVFAFKLFLHFARTGRLSMAETSGRGHDSVFEIQVANALQERGYQVHAQVGIAGFFIDLAVADPERPGRYILGIECDGAAYHNARCARDRDRLRQAVLEDHGWIIHRIWSTDWFQRPQEQLQLTIAAVEAAKAELETRGERTPVRNEQVIIDREEPAPAPATEISSSVPYVQATPRPPAGWPELHETPPALLAQMVEEVVTVEGPIHADEVVARIRSAWDLQRSGVRIQTAIERAMREAMKTRRLQRVGEFLSITGSPVNVRDRSEVASLGLRKPEMLPPQEIRVAVIQVVAANLGGHQDQVTLSVLRLLGFKSSSAQLREVVQSAIDALVIYGTLVQQGEYLVLAKAETAGNPSA
ncbi:MAG: DUF3320 domain-containing protein [Acidobacteriia bacterium]|nr:DUF3320 domain-containing protein [Terriglobia bacterium]